MDVIKPLRPGQPGTKRLQRRFGDRLLIVRYRHDAESDRRFTTVELIIDEGPRATRTPQERRLFPRPNQRVHVRIAYDETALRATVKAAGGTWDTTRRAWIVPYAVAADLGLTDRILGDAPDVD